VNTFKVGLLTLAGIVSLAIISIGFASKQSVFGDYKTYKAILDDAKGVFPNTSVRVAGIKAGQIKSVELYGSKALLYILIDKKIKITSQSTLRIKSLGLLGDKYLDIFLGSADGVVLPEGSLINVQADKGLSNLGGEASDLIAEVKKVATLIQDGLRDENGNNVLGELLDNVNQVSASLRKVLTGNENRLDRILANIESISENLAYETSREDGALISEIQSNLSPLLGDAKDAMEDLRLIVSDVRSGKGTVGKLLRDEETVDELNSAIKNVNRLVNRINNIESRISIFTGLNSEGGGHTEFNLDLYTAPERYYRIGVVNNEFGPASTDEETELTTTSNGSSSVISTREIRRDGFKFNAQLGRRYGRWGVRAGLIESTGGFGVDYFLTDYNTRFGFEAFDYQEEIGPNIRLSFDYRVWNVFYARVSGEDLINDERSVTFSGGLRFTDQDLSSLIGILAR